MKWIDVQKETPKIGQHVIATNGDEVAELIFFCGENGYYYFEDDEGLSLSESITHWMHLPKPPRKKVGEK